MRRRRWLRWLVLLLLVLLAADQGLTWLLRRASVRSYLIARLSANFGRPVEVSNFAFSLLGGPRLEANYVTVGEDPRFGHEYFLRAEKLTASPRWRFLLRGRFEFGTLALSRPSLNLVRAPDGRWNLESWLPPQAAPGATPSAPNSAARLYRIDVDEGRINFKRGADKHPFALVDVAGSIEQESAGRWRIDIAARPMRAAVVLQEPGTMRLRGRLAGTSVRLQPAELQFTWEDVSLSDALRLARGEDLGVRGRLALEVAARSRGDYWAFNVGARLREIHRWDLPTRPTDPSVNLGFDAQWWPARARVEVANVVLEAPRSNARATGFVQWAHPRDSRFRIVSSGVSLDDLLAWYRAFRPGVAEGAALEGNLGLDLEVGGWPLRLARGAVVSDGARLRGILPEPIGIGRTVLRLQRDSLELAPVAFAFAGLPAREAAARAAGRSRSDETLLLEASASRSQPGDWKLTLNVAGQTQRVQYWLAAANALGWTLLRGWSLEGPSALRLSLEGRLYPFSAQPTGFVDLRNAQLRSPLLNQPANLTNVRVEFHAGERSIRLSAARVFGAIWSGVLRQNRSLPNWPWEFSLAVDRLDVAELDRWLNPWWRETLLQRLVPGGGDQAEAAERAAALSSLSGRGRIAADQLALGSLILRRLRAQIELNGRDLRLEQAQAEFYDGLVRGGLRAQVTAQPVYDVHAQFERVKLAALAATSADLAGRCAGTASAQVTFVARGVGRDTLIRSLQGGGVVEIREAQWRGVNLLDSLRAASLRPGISEFRAASARFIVADRELRFEKLRLLSAAMELEADGSVDFSRAIDLRLRVPAPRIAAKVPAPLANLLGRAFRLRGSLASPELTPLEPPR